jgi:electron transfer flavoprotein alpha subunit
MIAPVPRPLGVVVMVKQVPLSDAPERLTSEGRLHRSSDAAEINPWCRRAITAAIQIARSLGLPCTAISMGPPAADAALREARAAGVDATLLLSDSALAGSDALATATALAHVIQSHGGARVVVCGYESIDGSTGVVPAMLAELLDASHSGPFVDFALDEQAGRLTGHVQGGEALNPTSLQLPAVITMAERSVPPAKVPWEQARHAEAPLVVTGGALVGGALGPHSRTRVASVVPQGPSRRPRVVPAGPEAVAIVADLLDAAAAADQFARVSGASSLPVDRSHRTSAQSAAPDTSRPVLVLCRTGGPHAVRLVQAARRLTRGDVCVVVPSAEAIENIHGASRTIALSREDAAPVSAFLEELVGTLDAIGVVAAADLWERHVLARLAVRLDAGLLTDLESVVTDPDNPEKWLGGKSAGDGCLAMVASSSPVQLASVRTGRLPEASVQNYDGERDLQTVAIALDERVEGSSPTLGSAATDLEQAGVVVGVGRPVTADDLGDVQQLADLLGAPLAATRPVTDAGTLEHARQVGVTGATAAPRVYLALGISGHARHLNGVTGAQHLIAVNNDPEARIFEHCDIGVVGEWRSFVGALVAALEDRALLAPPSHVLHDQPIQGAMQ